ncbi:Centriolar coiled-coil protein, partial [Aphis craccivora]
MALRTDMYVSCIKIFGVPIVPPLMTDQIRQEMKEYKEKAIAYEHKFKGRRVSLDSGVMITSTEMQKIENYESPTTVLKEPVYNNVNNINKIAILNGIKTDGSISPETPTLISEEDEHNSNNSSSNKQPIIIQSETVSLTEKSDDTLIPQQESNSNLTVNNSITLNEDNLNDNSLYKESSIKSANHNLIQNSSDTLVPKQEPTQLLTVANTNIHVDGDNISTKRIPRLRSNSYTLSSPSPIMGAFLNSQVQQQLMGPKSLENNINHSKESKSEPLSIYMTNDNDEKILK